MSSNAGAPNDSLSQMRGWFDTCPLFTKYLIYSSSGIAVLNFLTGISYLLVNFPILTISGFQIHRLLFSPFASLGLLQILFGFLAYLPMCARKEREWGTVKTVVDFFWKNFIINMVYIAFAYLLSPLTSFFLQQPCYGLWPIFFYYLVERCLLDPNGVTQVFCFPIHVRNTYYPIALLLLFSLMSSTILFDDVAAILVGYLHFRFLNTKYLAFLDGKASNWEKTVLFSWMTNKPNFVNSSGTMTGGSSFPAPGGQPTPSSYNAPAASQGQSNNQFNAFAGKGITLGGAPNNNDARNAPKKNKNYMELEDEPDDLENGTNQNGGR